MRRKLISVILICMICTAHLPVSANEQKLNVQPGVMIAFNGDATDYTSVIYNNIHYVPMKKVFEQMGAIVFSRSEDGYNLVLSGNGDIMRHRAGDNFIVVNGEEKYFSTSSVLENNETYIPLEMILTTLWPDEIVPENQCLNIKKNIIENAYQKAVKDVLDVAWLDDFYPEKFQEYIAYHIKMPSYSMQDVIFRVNINLDKPFYTNVTTIEHPNELLVLVNKYNKLPENFTQYNLVNMESQYTVRDGKQYLLEEGAYEHYVMMADAAKNDGISMKVVSAYRTESYQSYLYNTKVRAIGTVYADNYSARAGHSEHQTGLAVDINSTLVSFENTAAFKWLQEHAYEYGFIMRYPKDKKWITGYAYEPWHYRYVGEDVAKVIHDEGITYEEYYVKYISVHEFR